MLWSAVATGDARLAAQALGRRRRARLDELGHLRTLSRRHRLGGVDIDAAAVGLDGHVHRGLLSDFYAGNAAGSFARGKVFQHNVLGESPISGTLASLCGVEAALAGDDSVELELALRRLESMYSVVFSFGGMPLIYMGDELQCSMIHLHRVIRLTDTTTDGYTARRWTGPRPNVVAIRTPCQDVRTTRSAHLPSRGPDSPRSAHPPLPRR